MTKNVKDTQEVKAEIGKTYGYTPVLDKASKHARTRFLCRCEKCGATFRSKATDIQERFKDGCMFCQRPDGATEDIAITAIKEICCGKKVEGGATVIDVVAFSNSPEKLTQHIPLAGETYMLCEYGDGHREIHPENGIFPKMDAEERSDMIFAYMFPSYCDVDRDGIPKRLKGLKGPKDAKYEAGKQYGSIEVLSSSKGTAGTAYACRCLKCGSEFTCKAENMPVHQEAGCPGCLREADYAITARTVTAQMKGETWGRWTVQSVSFKPEKRNGKTVHIAYAKCTDAAGHEEEICMERDAKDAQGGKAGAGKKDVQDAKKIKVEVGKTYGYTTVLDKASKYSRTRFLCRCEKCGATFKAKAKDIQGKFKDGCVFCRKDGVENEHTQELREYACGDKVNGDATVIDIAYYDDPTKPVYVMPRDPEIFLLCEHGDGRREILEWDEAYDLKGMLDNLYGSMGKVFSAGNGQDKAGIPGAHLNEGI